MGDGDGADVTNLSHSQRGNQPNTLVRSARIGVGNKLVNMPHRLELVVQVRLLHVGVGEGTPRGQPRVVQGRHEQARTEDAGPAEDDAEACRVRVFWYSGPGEYAIVGEVVEQLHRPVRHLDGEGVERVGRGCGEHHQEPELFSPCRRPDIRDAGRAGPTAGPTAGSGGAARLAAGIVVSTAASAGEAVCAVWEEMISWLVITSR